MRDQENLGYRWLGDFSGPRSWIRGRDGPVVDLALACRRCVSGVPGIPFRRWRSARSRRRRALGFIWPICGTGNRHACSVFPTRHLVVTGLYRYVRNPMYVAVVSAILGQGLILGNVGLLQYGGLVWLLFHFFVLIYEEPTLRASFGSDYATFCAGVPRWIPRLTPWICHLDA